MVCFSLFFFSSPFSHTLTFTHIPIPTPQAEHATALGRVQAAEANERQQREAASAAQAQVDALQDQLDTQSKTHAQQADALQAQLAEQQKAVATAEAGLRAAKETEASLRSEMEELIESHNAALGAEQEARRQAEHEHSQAVAALAAKIDGLEAELEDVREQLSNAEKAAAH